MEKMLLSGRPDLTGRTCAVHNFIEMPDAEPCEKEPYVVMACRLSREKGIACVREAALKLPHIRFRIAGSGPDGELLEGIPNVELLGFLSVCFFEPMPFASLTSRVLETLASRLGTYLHRSSFFSLSAQQLPMRKLSARSLPNTNMTLSAWKLLMPKRS